jgi:hypothetical protein
LQSEDAKPLQSTPLDECFGPARFNHVRREREAAAARIYRSLKNESGDSGQARVDGHQLSHPGEPAEREADAVADHVADGLHGGNTGAGEQPGVKQGAPSIAAKLKEGAISRKEDPAKKPAGGGEIAVEFKYRGWI